jgi:hypothetical protein
MHNPSHIGPVPVNQQVHADFTGHVPPSRKFASFNIDDDHVRRSHHSLAHGRRRYQDAVSAQADGQVAIHPGYIAAAVQHPAETYNLLSIFAFAWHSFCPFRGYYGWSVCKWYSTCHYQTIECFLTLRTGNRNPHPELMRTSPYNRSPCLCRTSTTLFPKN